jgi:putative endonuclease
LAHRGYRILETGYRFGRGEIDIVAVDGDTVVFLEVKTRFRSSPQTPEEAVTPAKRRQLRRLAAAYLYERHLENIKCRFDVLALRFDPESGFDAALYRDAFD